MWHDHIMRIFQTFIIGPINILCVDYGAPDNQGKMKLVAIERVVLLEE